LDKIASIQAALTLGRNQLNPHSDTAGQDAQVLLAHLLDQSKAWVLAHPEHSLPEETQQKFIASLRSLNAGVPLAYILGRWEFFGRSFEVTPEVLIPRPETEGLVEYALEYLERSGRAQTMIDVGTGSGCIAITLAAERPDLRVIATDRSLGALKLAQGNAIQHAVIERLSLIQSHLLGGLRKRVSLIVANLPYIPSARLKHLTVAAHEPHLALDGGEQGLDLIVGLVDQLPYHLLDGGMAILELDHSHARSVIEHMSRVFPEAQAVARNDLNHLSRYAVLTL
jgi:release factor glutamine methyltransferase